MTMADVKRLMGKAVKICGNAHFDANTEFVLTAYVLRLHRGKLLHQLIVQDKSGAEYTVRLEEAYEVSQSENNGEGSNIRQQERSRALSAFGTTYEKRRDTGT